jgi:hypothetical protein
MGNERIYRGDPGLGKELAEERQREILDEVEADRVADGDMNPARNHLEPIATDDSIGEDTIPESDRLNDHVDNMQRNQHIHDED